MGVNWTNVTEWSDVIATANTNSDGWFWTLILYSVFIISSLLNSKRGFDLAILMSAFISLIFGLLLTYAGLVSWTWTMSFVGIIVIMFLKITWDGNK